MKKFSKIAVFFVLVWATSVIAQNQNQKQANEKNEDSQTIDLSKMNVKGDVLAGDKSAYSVTKLDAQQIDDLKLSRTADIIEQIPGISVSEYNQGGISNAFIMRGFDSGIHGGDMGVYLDGIPLNEYYGHGGGYADVNVLIPLELDRILLYKGPSTALYGNFSRAGTVSFYTKQKGTYTRLFQKYGAYNLMDTQGAFGFRMSDNLWNNTAIQFYNTDGFTENSSHLYGNASTKFTYEPSQNIEIILSLRAHSARWDAPGYISRTQWEDSNQRYNQDPNMGNDGGERTQTSERLDVNYAFSEHFKLLYWGYALQSEWIRWAAFPPAYNQSERNYRINKYGTGASINYTNKLHTYLDLAAVAGIEYHADDTKYLQFNSKDRTRTTGPTKDYDTTFQNFTIFAESEFKIVSYFKPVIGIRADLFSGKEDDDVNSTSRSFDISKYYYISPKVGFVSTLVKDIVDFKFSFSNGYQLPPADALYNNVSLDPSNIYQYEAGFAVTFHKMLQWNISAYLLDTDNEVQDTTGSGDYKNIGKTRRTGVESDFTFTPVKGFSLIGSLTFTDTEILKSATTSIEGKSITTIPKLKARLGASYVSAIGIGASAKWTFMGESYTNDDNSETRPAYHLFDVGIFYKMIHKGQVIIFNLDAKNVTNTHYATYASGDLYWTTGAPFRVMGSISTKF